MKDEIIYIKGKTYIEYQPVEFGEEKVYLEDGRVKIISKIEKINVANYDEIVIIEGKLYREVKNVKAKRTSVSISKKV